MNVLIACHAGAGLGLGHLARSLVVARTLNQVLGAKVQLLIQGDPVQRDDLAEFGHQFLGIKESLSDIIRQQAQQFDAQIVVLDLHPRLILEDIDMFLVALRQSGCKVIGIDSLVGHRGNLDLVFIPSFCFSAPEYQTDTAPILFGWDCFLLNVKRTPIEWKPGRQVLALAGGSDATGLGKTWPTLLDEALPVGIHLNWVTGPYAQQPVWPVSPRLSLLNHQAPSNLDNLMMTANYAVTVYGVSFFELLYYGVPTVVFSPYGNKDDAELAGIDAEGIALVARDEVEAVAKLKELMTNDKLAASLSLSARQRLAVSGGHKFVQALMALMA
jgi:spore coat polysaccharide biosynthesis predicted glycosyltransferase SpsG